MVTSTEVNDYAVRQGIQRKFIVKLAETENDNGRDEDNNMNDDVGVDDLLENSTSRPTRKAMISAREKIQRWLSPENNLLLWGVLWIM